MTELGLMFSDRAQCIAEVIRPPSTPARIVLCDRYTDSTEAYQGGGRQLGSERVLRLHKTMCGGLNPDLTILLLRRFRPLPRPRAPPQRPRRRRRTATKAASKREDEAFYRRVYDKYQEIAAREPGRVGVH